MIGRLFYALIIALACSGWTHGAIVVSPGPSWNGTINSGGASPVASATPHGSGFALPAIGNFDSPPNIWIEAGNCNAITIGAAVADRGWIKEVDFWLEGTTVVVSSQTTNPCTGSFGWTVTPRSTSTQNGDASFCATIIPVNGLERVVCQNFTLNTSPSGAGYVDRTTIVRYISPAGSDSNAGTSSGSPWQTFQKAAVASSNGAIVYYLDGITAGTPQIYNENATNPPPFGNTNTHMIDFRPMTVGGTATIIKTIVSGQFLLRASRISFTGIIFDASTVSGPQLNGGQNVTGAANNGSGLIRLTVSTTTAFSSGFPIRVSGVIGTAEANGNWLVTVIDGTHLDLQGSSFVNVYLSGGLASPNSTVIFKNCQIIDPNGPTGAPFAGAGGWGTPGVNGQAAFYLETSFSVGQFTGWSMIRNLSGIASGDVFEVAVADVANYGGGTRVFNALVTQPVEGHIRQSTQINPVVSSAVFGGTNTVISWQGSPGLLTNNTQFDMTAVTGSRSQAILGIANNGAGGIRVQVAASANFTTGNNVQIDGVVGTTEANNYWTITVIDGTHIDLTTALNGQSTLFVNAYVSGGRVGRNWTGVTQTAGGTTTVSGDASGLASGDTTFISSPIHSDSFQFFLETNNVVPNPTNIYLQRYKAVGTSFQLQFVQRGTSTSSGTISTVGIMVTFSAPNTWADGDFVYAISGAQSGTARRLVGSGSNSTTGTLAGAFASDVVAGTTWARVRSALDIAVVDSMFVHTGNDGAEGQVQWGAANWVQVQTSLIGPYVFRPDITDLSLQSWTVFDSYFGTLDSAGAFPSTGVNGINVDQNQFGSGSGRGTNSVVGAVTFDSSYRPTGGTMTQTMAGIQGGVLPNGTPFIPWDIYGVAVAPGAVVGAAQP